MKFKSNNTVFYYLIISCVLISMVTAAFIYFLRNKYNIVTEYAIYGGLLLGGIYLGFNLRRSQEVDEKAMDTKGEPEKIKPMEIDSELWDGFDSDDPRYPEELDIAFQAWLSVRKSVDAGPVRGQLTIWLKTAYPSLPLAAIDRIVGVCNWDKNGGRPKNPQ